MIYKINWFKTYHKKTNGAKTSLSDDKFGEIKGNRDVSITLENHNVNK